LPPTIIWPATSARASRLSAIITEADTWQALRLGVVGEAMVTDRLKISGEAAYLPYLTFDGLDNHFLGNTASSCTPVPPLEVSGNVRGIPAVVTKIPLASYDLTPQFSIGVGARYWAMWTTNGSYTLAGVTPPISFRGAAEQAGTFLQAAFKFRGP
jgi:hypothetical protein